MAGRLAIDKASAAWHRDGVPENNSPASQPKRNSSWAAGGPLDLNE
jgi:hypothetical protein